MSNAIDIAWASCHVRVNGMRLGEMHGIPEVYTDLTASRLLNLGAKSAKVVSPGVVQFNAKKAVFNKIFEAFPCCPIG